MDKTSLLLVIVRRDWEADYASMLWRGEAAPLFSLPAQGTASQSLLNLLGLERLDKTLLVAMTSRRHAARLMNEMVSSMGINMSGTGIALRVPVGSIGGVSSMNYFLKARDNETDEVNDMDEKKSFPFDLIIAIARQGAIQQVMDAARTAGAGGGTVVHAKGIGEDYGEKFFGMSLASEKEMVLIVTRHEQKDAIMSAIMEHAGMNTPAHAAVFSLPVEDVVGLTSVMKPPQD